MIYSGVPLALSWSVLVGWSVIRLVKRFAQEPKVSEALLMGATAVYLHIGLTAGLVMGILIDRFASNLDRTTLESDHRPKERA